MAQATYENDPFWNPAATPAVPAEQAQPSRWSYHLGSDPLGGAAGAWAKQYYDNPNIDPNAALQEQASRFRSQYGSDAPEDDRSIFEMIATGQRPQSKQIQQNTTGQYPVQQYPSQLGMVQGTPRNTELYDLLKGRATQALNLDRNDPILKAQADAYAANEERARRNYISDVAEKEGPLANIRGEERMAAERVGQRTGAFEAQLMARELQTRRDEISQALGQMGDMLSDDQRLALQRELSLIDSALQREQMVNNLSIQQGQLDLERALGTGRLGLDAENQASYWDWRRSGGD